MRASGSMCWSPQMPMSAGEIRPSRVTALASTMTSARPAYGTAAKVNQVPVAGQPLLLRNILAHGRHHDPVAELDAAYHQRTEQINFRDLPVVVGVSRAAVGRDVRGRFIGSLAVNSLML